MSDNDSLTRTWMHEDALIQAGLVPYHAIDKKSGIVGWAQRCVVAEEAIEGVYEPYKDDLEVGAGCVLTFKKGGMSMADLVLEGLKDMEVAMACARRRISRTQFNKEVSGHGGENTNE